MDAIYTLGLINSNRLCKDSVLKGLYPIILLNFFKLKVILFILSFFDLVNTPHTKLSILDIVYFGYNFLIFKRFLIPWNIVFFN